MTGMTDTTLVLVGNAKAGTISVLELDDGSLEPLAEYAVGVGCSTFALDRDRGLLYTAVKEPEPAVVTLSFDPGSAVLAEVSRRTLPDPLAYLALTHDGGLLLGASYAGNWGRTWPVRDGVLGEQVGRVEAHHLHCVLSDAPGQFAYWVALGDDAIVQTGVAADGSTKPLGSVAADAGAGPRHLVLSADGASAYLVTEFTGEVVRFDRDASGQLTRAESVSIVDPSAGLATSRLGADPMAEKLVWGADVHLARGGRFLVASERTASTLAVVALDESGHLGEVVGFTPTEAQPRGFAVAPDGEHVVVAGERSGGVALYALSEAGELAQLDRLDTGSGPNWVRFV